MKIASIMGVVALVGIVLLPPHNTVDGCAEAMRHRTQPGIVHECDGLTAQQQQEALRLSGR